MRLKDFILIALFTTILITQKLMLSFLPNIQLTVLLIILYTKIFKIKKTIIIVTLYTLIDLLIFGGISTIYFPFMLIAWLIMPILINTVFKKIESEISLAFISIVLSLIYSYILIIPNVVIFKIPFIPYLIKDIPFQILLSLSSFLSVLILYKPLKNILENVLKERDFI